MIIRNFLKISKSLDKCDPYWTQYKNKCLKHFNLFVDFPRAEEICKSKNATMISINSVEENRFVLDFIKNHTIGWRHHWLGAKRVCPNASTRSFFGTDLGSHFEWNNKNVFNYTNWGSGQPNKSKEKYLVMYPNGRWHDYNSKNYQFVCEKIFDN